MRQKISSTLSLVIGICAIVLTAHFVDKFEKDQALISLKIERETLSIELLKIQLKQQENDTSPHRTQ